MLGHKAGDNGQLLALAGELARDGGWPVEEKHLVYKSSELLTNLFAGPTLAGLVREKSSPLEPPWPELIISAGRRNEPLVRWIQQQAGRDRVKLVHVGRPWALHECFDLIVTTPQYRLPDKPNILHNEAPLHRVDAAALDEARARWAAKLAHLPRPRIAVALGGNAGPYDMDRENGALLGWHVERMARDEGGSLMITSSARTPAASIDALEAQIGVPHLLYRWRAGATDNPYLGFLAMADAIVVTCDSMSMLAEACATGKPVHVFDLLRGAGSKRPPLPADGSVEPRSAMETLRGLSLRPFFYKLGMTVGPSRLTRDVARIHRRQVEAGRAVWLGEPWPVNRTVVAPLGDLRRAAAAVRALFDDPPPPRPMIAPSRLPEWLRRFVQG
ncbi:MAG: mitochondrial fission ELM1 family protein [Geminicoccaceae bacterium]|nr:mitochondrial fission ELM1 family protein [Geminicoccaceae bacterium]